MKELNAELELLAERVKKLEEKDASDVRDDAREVPDKVQEKLNGIEDIVKSYAGVNISQNLWIFHPGKVSLILGRVS